MLLDDTISLEEDSSLDELGGTMLEEDCTELEDATLELLSTEELLGTAELDEGTALLLDTGSSLELLSMLLELSSLEEDSSLEELGGTMLEEERSTLILPVAEVLLSMPVTMTV